RTGSCANSPSSPQSSNSSRGATVAPANAPLGTPSERPIAQPPTRVESLVGDPGSRIGTRAPSAVRSRPQPSPPRSEAPAAATAQDGEPAEDGPAPADLPRSAAIAAATAQDGEPAEDGPAPALTSPRSDAA